METDPPSGPRKGLSGARLAVGMCAAHAFSMLGFGTFPGLLPQFLDLWSLTSTEAGWLSGIYFGAYIFAVPALVSLTDRIDPRWVYAVGALITAVAAFAFAVFAEGFWSALWLRALAGAGLAGTYMPGLKALTDHVPERIRPRSIAFYTSTFSIGAALSFFMAGEIAALADWRWAFAVAGVGPLLAVAIVILLVPRSRPEHLIPSQTALLDFRPVLRNRRAFAYVLAYSAHNWELFALRSWVVTFLIFSQSLQSTSSWSGLWSATTLTAVIVMLGLPASVLCNELAQKVGRRRLVMTVMLTSAVLAGGLGFLAGLPFPLVVLITLLYSVMATSDSASITAGAVANAAPGQRGATMAVHSFIGFAGAFVGPLVFGAVLDLGGGVESPLAWGLAFASSGLAVVMGPIALATLGRRGVAVQPPPPARGCARS